MGPGERTLRLAVVALLAIPVLHPLLIPIIGLPSHLLWWIHVLPVALVAFRHGRYAAAAIMLLSTVMVIAGEQLFGSGYGVPAPSQTTWSIAIAVLATHLLLSGFALYARGVSGRYRLLFDNTASAVLRTDARERIIAANPAALRLFRCRLEDLRGHGLGDVKWLRGLPEPRRLRESGWFGPISVGQGDDERIAHVAVAVTGTHDPAGHQILLVDRTPEVLHEQEMERQGRLATLGGTLAGLAHELKNPLQVIDGFSQLALDPVSSEAEVREALETVRSEAMRMTALVQELLGFSRSREEREEVAVAELVTRLVRIHRLAGGRTVQVRARSTWSGTLRVSAPKLEQILTNLLSNAMDAVPAGSGAIDVTVDGVGDDVLLRVADNGTGVDPALLDRIFEPFVTTKAAEVGTGLGLAISRRLARAMGGDLTAANCPEGGAVFTLRLPLVKAEAAPALPPTTLAQTALPA